MFQYPEAISKYAEVGCAPRCLLIGINMITPGQVRKGWCQLGHRGSVSSLLLSGHVFLTGSCTYSVSSVHSDHVVYTKKEKEPGKYVDYEIRKLCVMEHRNRHESVHLQGCWLPTKSGPQESHRGGLAPSRERCSPWRRVRYWGLCYCENSKKPLPPSSTDGPIARNVHRVTPSRTSRRSG